ncbi:MAG: glycosyltransferase 87 family protein [Candidatus Binatia bacterium]|nr:glycosyltransferase 87 family protein [Candidatus Binatia bacterium]
MFTFFLLVQLGVPLAALADAVPQNIENGALTEARAQNPELPAGWETSADTPHDGAFRWIDGNRGLGALEIHSATPVEAEWFQEAPVEPDRWYRFSAFVRMAGVSPKQAGARLATEMTAIAPDESPGSLEDSGWTPVVRWFHTAGDEHSVRVSCRLGGDRQPAAGEVACSRFRLEPVHGPPPHLAGESETARDGTFSGLLSGLAILTALLVAIGHHGRLHRSAESAESATLAWLLAAIGAAKIAQAPLFQHPGDLSIYGGWAMQLAEQGPARFYAPNNFADYPPGYMYVLWWIGAARNALGLAPTSAAYVVLLKLPAILADAAIAWLLFARLRPTDRRVAWGAALAFSLNPALWLNSAVWGQTDAILALLLFLAFLFQGERRFELASVFTTLAALTKPQALLVIPLLPLWPDRWWKGVRPLTCLAAALATTYIVAEPFRGPRPWSFLPDLYISTMGSYAETSVNAMNLPALLFGMRATDLKPIFGLTPNIWSLAIGLAIGALFFAAYLRRRDRLLFTALLASAMLVSFVCLSRMHERYLYPFFLFAGLISVTGPVGALYWALSAVFAVNQVVVLRWTDSIPPWIWQTGAVANGLLLLAWLAAVWQMARGRLSPSGEAALNRDEEPDGSNSRTGQLPMVLLAAAASLALASPALCATELIAVPPPDAPEDAQPPTWRLEGYRTDPGPVTFGWRRNEIGFGVLEMSTAIPNDLRWVRDVPVAPDTWYRIAGWLRADGVTTDVGVHLWIVGTHRQSRDVAGTSGWQPVTLWVKTGADETTLEVACRLGGGPYQTSGTAGCAGLTIEVASPPAADHGFGFEPTQPHPYETMAPLVQTTAVLLALLAGFCAWRSSRG